MGRNILGKIEVKATFTTDSNAVLRSLLNVWYLSRAIRIYLKLLMCLDFLRYLQFLVIKSFGF